MNDDSRCRGFPTDRTTIRISHLCRRFFRAFVDRVEETAVFSASNTFGRSRCRLLCSGRRTVVG